MTKISEKRSSCWGNWRATVFMPRGPDRLRLSETNIRLKHKQTTNCSSFESECYYVAVMSLCLLLSIVKYIIKLLLCWISPIICSYYIIIVGQNDRIILKNRTRLISSNSLYIRMSRQHVQYILLILVLVINFNHF